MRVPDSSNRTVYERVLHEFRSYSLDTAIASQLADDIATVVNELGGEPYVETLPSSPLLAPAFVLAANLQLEFDDALCFFLAAAAGDELLLLARPDERVLGPIRGRHPELRFSTLT